MPEGNRIKRRCFSFFEILLGLSQPFFFQYFLHRFVVLGKSAHIQIGCFLIFVTELMYPYQIKSVQELPSGRIGCMMTVSELIVVHDNA